MTKVRCENKLCIYYEKDKCCIEEISISSQGTCEECIQVEFEESELIKKRVALLEQLDRQCERIEKRFHREDIEDREI